TVLNLEQFTPWVWMLSRLFNSIIVVAGTLPFLWTARRAQTNRGVRYTLLTGILCALMSFAVVKICTRVEEFPVILSAMPGFVHRPLDLIPLVAYLLAAGIVLPRLYRLHRSLFTRGLQVSILPHVVSQIYAVGSEHLFDNAFYVASALKIVGYLVPLIGLLVDYTRAYQAQAALLAAEEQLNLAREIQLRLLPATAPQVAGWNIAGRCEFAEAIGGDYFDYLPLPDGRLRIVVADVSGHDPGASLLMANARAYLRAVTRPDVDLAAAIQQVNRFLCDDAHGRRFVTMFICEVAPGGDRVNYIGCGHAALLYSSSGECRPLDATGMPLGVTSDYKLEARIVSDLKAGDLLLLSTDGLTEAASRSGAMLGRDGVTSLLQSSNRRGSADVVEALFSGVHQFTERSAFQDDVTVVAVVRQ
ncbi:MAG: PP2C family protein-serine/threonine phosphatase, partial [Planctomycetaceae bacterium]|nr:PP2C family protein-serine/threonine phosphatase [Planctomycetaceae bacterium]